MQVLLEVLKDLWAFVYGDTRTSLAMPVSVLREEPKLLTAAPTKLRLAAAVAKAALPEPTDVVIDSTSDVPLVAVREAAIYREPTVSFDTKIATVGYGKRVEPERHQGRFTYVRVGAVTGWMLRDEIQPQSAVLPMFVRGHRYEAVDETTVRLRACIDDMFSGRAAQASLQPEEYVAYMLWTQGRQLPWSETWGRVPGTWQRKLRGIRGVHMDVQPRTGAVMEYILDDVGYLGYVKQVSPANDITLAGVGLTYESQYTEQLLTHDIWRELRPVFITLV